MASTIPATGVRSRKGRRHGQANCMYGLIAKLTAAQGRREELIAVLKSSAAKMPGCYSDVVAKDSADQNVIWVTEMRDSEARHDDSLSLPAVKQAVSRAKLIVSRFEKIAATPPVWDGGPVADGW